MGVSRGQVDRNGRFPRQSAKAGSHIANVGPRQSADGKAAQVLEPLLQPAEVLDLADGADADDEIRLLIQDRADQLFDVGRVVLIVRIRIDDDVGAFGEGTVYARLKCRGQTAVYRMSNDVIRTGRLRDLRGPIGAAVIDDQILDLRHAGD